MSSAATAYRECCEACLGSPPENGGSIAVRAAAVEGTLRAGVDVAFATCRRGHRLVIRRAARPLVTSASPLPAAPLSA